MTIILASIVSSVLTFDAHLSSDEYIARVKGLIPTARMAVVSEGYERYRVLIDKNRDGYADVVIRVDGTEVRRRYR